MQVVILTERSQFIFGQLAQHLRIRPRLATLTERSQFMHDHPIRALLTERSQFITGSNLELEQHVWIRCSARYLTERTQLSRTSCSRLRLFCVSSTKIEDSRSASLAARRMLYCRIWRVRRK